MGQAEAVPEFMQGRLLNTFEEEGLVGLLIVELGTKTMGRNNGTYSFHLRNSEYVFQNGHEEIYLGDAHVLESIPGNLLDKAAQDQLCIVL